MSIPREGDAGQRAVEHVFKALNIDEEWSIRLSRGFVWWGKDFAQRVWAAPPVRDQGLLVSRLMTVTPIVSGLTPSADLYKRLTLLNGMTASLSAFVFDSERQEVSLVCSTKVYDNPDDSSEDAFVDVTKRVFATAAGAQASQAHLTGEHVAGLLGGQLAISAHPLSGPRPEADEIVQGALRLLAKWGDEPSVWRGKEMDLARKTFQQLGAFSMGSAEGVSAEAPFGDETALIVMSTTERHPQLGNGLLIRLTLPLVFDLETGAKIAATLNNRELAEQPFNAFLGGWCASPSNMPAFVAFYPNVTFSAGYAAAVAGQMVMRVNWAASVFASSQPTTKRPSRNSALGRRRVGSPGSTAK